MVLAALADPALPRPDGGIPVAPAVVSRSDMPASYRVALWLGAHTFPAMTLSGRGVVQIWPSDNIPMLRAYSRDPLVQKQTRADAVYGLVNLMDEARHALEHIADPPPILFLYCKNDQVIPAAPTEAVVAALGAKAEVHRYDHGYHMLLRALDGPAVWQDVATWIGKPHPPTKAATNDIAGRYLSATQGDQPWPRNRRSTTSATTPMQRAPPSLKPKKASPAQGPPPSIQSRANCSG